MTNKTIFLLSILIIFSMTIGYSQSNKIGNGEKPFKPDLQDDNIWELINNSKIIKIKELN